MRTLKRNGYLKLTFFSFDVSDVLVGQLVHVWTFQSYSYAIVADIIQRDPIWSTVHLVYISPLRFWHIRTCRGLRKFASLLSASASIALSKLKLL